MIYFPTCLTKSTRNRKLKKSRQQNGQMKMNKRTNNDLPNIEH